MPDPEIVTLMGGYRVGFLPPVPGSLTAGELYVELGTEAGVQPRLWVGTPTEAGFVGDAASLVPVGVELPPPLPASVPVNVDIPSVQPEGPVAVGDTLSCTMGNWEYEPDAYAYQWKRDGAEDIGDGSDSYVVVDEDAGSAIGCVVTATNERGSTVAPPSNQVSVTPPAAEPEHAERSKPKRK